MSKEKSERFLEDLARLAARAAIEQAGVEPTVANAIGLATAEFVSIHCGGSEFYLSKDLAILKRHRDLYAAYCQQSPVDYSELAQRFQLSERYVRSVLSKMIAQARANRQRPLFSLPEDPSKAA